MWGTGVTPTTGALHICTNYQHPIVQNRKLFMPCAVVSSEAGSRLCEKVGGAQSSLAPLPSLPPGQLASSLAVLGRQDFLQAPSPDEFSAVLALEAQIFPPQVAPHSDESSSDQHW